MCSCTLLQVLELEGQRAAADKQWQERLASEQASSQQHHLRAGRMEVRLPSMLTKHMPHTPAVSQTIMQATSHFPLAPPQLALHSMQLVHGNRPRPAGGSYVCQCLVSRERVVLTKWGQLLPALTHPCASAACNTLQAGHLQAASVRLPSPPALCKRSSVNSNV